MGVRAPKARMHFFQKKAIMTVKKHGMRTSMFKTLKGCALFGVSEGGSIKAWSVCSFWASGNRVRTEKSWNLIKEGSKTCTNIRQDRRKAKQQKCTASGWECRFGKVPSCKNLKLSFAHLEKSWFLIKTCPFGYSRAMICEKSVHRVTARSADVPKVIFFAIQDAPPRPTTTTNRAVLSGHTLIEARWPFLIKMCFPSKPRGGATVQGVQQ